MSASIVLPERDIALPHWFNMGGPKSRTRSERLRSTILGNDDGIVQCPRVIRVGLGFREADPLEVLDGLLREANVTDPEDLRSRYALPTEPCICRRDRKPRPLQVTAKSRDKVFRQLLILGLSTEFQYDPGRPLLFTRTSLTRRLELFDGRGFYA